MQQSLGDTCIQPTFILIQCEKGIREAPSDDNIKYQMDRWTDALADVLHLRFSFIFVGAEEFKKPSVRIHARNPNAAAARYYEL